jgi:hypothetical protein
MAASAAPAAVSSVGGEARPGLAQVEHQHEPAERLAALGDRLDLDHPAALRAQPGRLGRELGGASPVRR